jgi:magnesium chelatase subunit H
VVTLQKEIDAMYGQVFQGVVLSEDALQAAGVSQLPDVSLFTEASFSELGRANSAISSLLFTSKESQDPRGWLAFQTAVNSLKLQRSRAGREAQELAAAAEEAARRDRMAASPSEYDTVSVQWNNGVNSSGNSTTEAGLLQRDVVKIVLITGFESFNVELYKRAAVSLSRGGSSGIAIKVYSDRDIEPKRAEIESALATADVFFGSLLFDFDQVEWLRERIQTVPLRFIFESSLELMSCTKVGGFEMAAGGKAAGPPPAVKKVLSMFGSGREEDKMVGYLSFLKIGPKLLKYLPGKKVKDLRTWLTVYSYWNQGGLENVEGMFQYLVRENFQLTNGTAPPSAPAAVIETPATGCLHPAAPGRYFASPAEYWSWYTREYNQIDSSAPIVAVLLYRKHVITNQPYINQLIECMEQQGLRPLPIFINGVEAHTVVRDQLTTAHEKSLLASGQRTSPTLRTDAVKVDAIVNTIGFPLVGGPAGTMEGGRQSEIAKAILSSKNVPYTVAAPLLIQDMESWVRDGIGGLQSVVLYSLPELDGAIDTVPLGGLVKDDIFLVPERVIRLANRLKKWIQLRSTPPSERKIAMLLYGFPPGVGAAGTAALLNVPKSLETVLQKLREEGYDLGDLSPDVDGESLVTALRNQAEEAVVSRGAKGITAQGAGPAAEFGVTATAVDVSSKKLKEMLTFPEEWGPTEWGPIPFLPEKDILVQKMERQWGDLQKYRSGLSSTTQGDSVVSGLQFGNVFIGVQPLLGVEGDPMRLLFERDLTPHPQYAAFYKYLQNDFEANAVVHFGMHGTVEWLPGVQLGNSGFSWSDVLLGDLPNVYIYAANNPSESIIAKRRGYGTIVSHNVPPYGRAGLYKQLAELKALVTEYRESPERAFAYRVPIVEQLASAGLQKDCPFTISTNSVTNTSNSSEVIVVELTSENVDSIETSEFDTYVSKLYFYLQEVEGRLFSEGLHVLGRAPSAGQAAQYLGAYFGDRLPTEAVDAVVANSVDTSVSSSVALAQTKAELERIFSNNNTTTTNSSSSSTSSSTCFLTENNSISDATLEEALKIRSLLNRNTEEIDGVLRALNGEYILPEAGGDLLRDGAGVLPTGRNIHALDPYRMPGPAAMARGAEAAEKILVAHREQNNGAWPETVAVNLWGLDAIKTKGESVGIVLTLIGARPVKEGTGRIARFELIPLEELGRPRIDVLANMSGIFRDSFQNVVELLDDAVQRAAAAEGESEEMNFVKKHSAAMAAQGLTNPTARLFSNPAGDYGSMVNERVGASNWEDGDELGATWASRNAFSYGRGKEKGTARPEVLQALLATTDRVVQEVDSVEYGLTDIQEYYANTGALRRAAQSAKGPGARPVGCSIVECFSKEVKPRELEEVLRLEYRSKLLNPKWAEAMSKSGSGGAFEISQRMTAMIGWGATADFKENWTWDQAAETYALDPLMADRLRKSNPQAFANTLKRMLEAAGRGMWDADEATLERLRGMFSEMDDELEGVGK